MMHGQCPEIDWERFFRALKARDAAKRSPPVLSGFSFSLNNEAGPVFALQHAAPILCSFFHVSFFVRHRVDAFMFLPTMTGQWKLDNRNLPETDITRGVHTGDLPISK